MKASLFTLFLLASGAFAQETATPRYKFKAGEQRTFVMEQKMVMKMNINGMDIETKVDQTFDMIWEVKKVDGKGSADMQMKVGRMKMTIDGFTGILEVDSANLKDAKDDVGKILNQVVAALAATRVNLKKNARGEISDVEVPEDVRKKLDALPDTGMGNKVDESTLRALTQGVVFPESIAKGKDWKQSLKMDLPVGKIDTDFKYTYLGQEERGAEKVEKFSYLLDMKIEPAAYAMAKITLKSSDGKGHLYFDNKAGAMLEQFAEVAMQMDVEVAGMTFTQNIRQTTTVKLKEGK